MALSITSANAVFTLVILPLYPSVTLQGYAADDAFSTASVDVTETMMGVDGKLVGGWVPKPIEQTVVLFTSSPSVQVFDYWYAQHNITKDAIVANGAISLPGIRRNYTLTRGFLKGYNALPDVKKTLGNRTFTIVWESVVGANF